MSFRPAKRAWKYCQIALDPHIGNKVDRLHTVRGVQIVGIGLTLIRYATIIYARGGREH